MKPFFSLCGTLSAGSLLLMSTSALAQDAKLQDKALAAGYKAMFTCSAVFNGGKTAEQIAADELDNIYGCLLYTSPSPRDRTRSRMPSSA